MEVLAAIRSHIVAAKNSLIKAGVEMQKLPVPMQHGLRIMQTVLVLDKLAEWLQSDQAESSEAQAVRGKPKRRSRLQKKQDQSHPETERPLSPLGPTPSPIANNAAEILRRNLTS